MQKGHQEGGVGDGENGGDPAKAPWAMSLLLGG